MWTPLRRAGRIQRVSVENEKADAGRDGRTRLAIIDSQARTGTGKNIIFLVQLTTSRIDNHARLIHTLLKVLTIHTVYSVNSLYSTVLFRRYNLKEKSELVLCIFYINLSGVNHTGTQ